LKRAWKEGDEDGWLMSELEEIYILGNYYNNLDDGEVVRLPSQNHSPPPPTTHRSSSPRGLLFLLDLIQGYTVTHDVSHKDI
jgi:hypothetical protein